MKNKTEEELIALCLLQDNSAFAELMRRNNAVALFTVQKFIFNKDDRKDVIQKSWIKIWKAFSENRYQQKGYKFSSYLQVVIKNESFDWLRVKSNRIMKVDIEPERFFTSPESVAFDGTEMEAGKKIVKLFRSSLSPLYKEVFTLRFMFRFKYEEIAESLGLPLGTIKARIFRINRLLKAYLKNAA